ncbi:major facilitator superfamily domain-containing protein [Paraphoma chrysanthemicola]|uniref:Major facilitator superfamily domain-containing protein n=1 Tax=Paraphoma chrysanthemicola TaxID=798071 RepID=A0A8K0R4F4_9PLEO|nr:major facilitator superfamily domain-containing protein [Paraphoma chrysanthemicola]
MPHPSAALIDAEAGPAATASTATAPVRDQAVSGEKCPRADTDTNIVNWEGPEDPKNPRNWTQGFKMLNVLLIGLSILCTNFATTMFAPAAPQLADEFNVHSSILTTLSITIPSLGAATGPLLFAPLSEIFGRVRIYIVTSLLFVAFAVGLARSTGIAMFLVFRFLDGVCFTSYLTCGAGTIADLFDRDNRGAASAVFALAPLLGPVLGPVIGGFVAQELGWRWIFYIILMVTGAITVVVIIFMRESMETVLLERKAKRLRKSTGNSNLRSAVASDLPVKMIVSRALSRPIRMLIFSPIVLLLGLYLAFVFGLTFLLLATLSEVFENTYGFKQGFAGLAFLGLGIGCVIGTIIFAKFSDKMAKKNSAPEHRLVMMMLGGPFVPASLFWYGWSVEYHVHWIVPIIGTGFIGIGIVFVTASGQLYMIDNFGAEGSASAMAALTLVRNGSGAFLPLAAPPLYRKLGLGWGNSVLGLISLTFLPLAFLFYKFGQRLRERYPFQI